MTVNLQYILDGVLIVAAVAFICYRQMTWRPVDPARLWRMPLIMGVVGAGIIVTGDKGVELGTADIAALALELVVSLGIGALMGAIAHFRPMSPEARAAYAAKRGDGADASVVRYQSRTGWVGLALWVVMIGVRVGLDLAAQHFGAHALTSTGVILLVIAANRAARAAVFAYRIDQHRQSVAADVA
jgi:hypothetical protein